MSCEQSEIAKRAPMPAIICATVDRKPAALERCDAVRQQIILMPISKTGMVS
jgi:hypothetical protein